MSQLHSLVREHIYSIQPTWRTLTAISHVVMFGASVGAFVDPLGAAKQIGCPLPTTTTTSTADSRGAGDSAASKADTMPARQHTVGWPLMFADRNMSLALSGLALNYLGEFRALAVMGQVMTLAGLGDAYATWKYGTPGSWKGHLIPTVVMSWMGPLGLLMYFG